MRRDPDTPDTRKTSPQFRAWVRRTKRYNPGPGYTATNWGLDPEREIRTLIGCGTCHDRAQALWLMFLSGDLYSFSDRGKLHRISRKGKAIWVEENNEFGYQITWRHLSDLKLGRQPIVRSLAEIEMRARTFGWKLPRVPPHVEVDWGTYRGLYVVSPIAPVAREIGAPETRCTLRVLRCMIEALVWLQSQDTTYHKWIPGFCARHLARLRIAIHEKQYRGRSVYAWPNHLGVMWNSLRQTNRKIAWREPLAPDPALWGDLPDYPIFGIVGTDYLKKRGLDGEEEEGNRDAGA